MKFGLSLRLFLASMILTLAPSCFAGTRTAASCNQSDVSAIINTAVDGDVIQVPSGSCTWSSGITVPSGIGITITGTGTPQSGSGTTGASSSCTNTSITVTGGVTLFTFDPEYGNSTTRLSCMNIASGSGSGVAFRVLGKCTSSGCPNLRVDNITFPSSWGGHANVGNSYGIAAVGDMFGVLDHNTITGTSGNYLQLVEQSNASYMGVGQFGDNSWAQPESYGSANFLFFENNLFTYSGTTDNEGSAGAYENTGGGRIVVRYNTFNEDGLNEAAAWHGTESGGRYRGGRTWEFYDNTINCPASTYCQPQVGARSGTGLTWGNTMNFASSANEPDFLALNTYRAFGPSGNFLVCDGSSVWDTNDGISYYTGTVSSYNGSTGVITVSGSPGWTTNQWFVNGAPYSVHDVTQNSGGEITASGSNTLTIAIPGGPGQYVPASGDSIQILRAKVCIDQAGGRGAGYLNSGTVPQNVTANEVLSPTYEWMDSFIGATPYNGVVNSDTARVIANRDYYAENANQAAQTSPTEPFNGTSGTGHGTLTNKPATCTPGVGYWATDQGNWNQSGLGGQGELYTCTAANSWTLLYTPYTYPHPLVSGSTSSNSPLAPNDLTATAK